MGNLVNTEELVLAKGQIIRVPDAAGSEIRVKEGSVWITQDREGADHVVGTGGSFRIDRPGVTLVSALQAGRIQLRESSVAASPFQLVP